MKFQIKNLLFSRAEFLKVGRVRPRTAVLFFTLCLCAFVPLSLSLEIQNVGASLITSSNAVLSANLVSTNATNAAVTVYYGAGNGGTNTALWQYSNYFGVVSTGLYSCTTTNLSPATYFFYRAAAIEGTNTAWPGTSSNFTTLSRLPTNYPSGTNPATVMAWSNGVLAAPPDFFSANGVISITNTATPGDVLTADGDGKPIWKVMTVQATNELDPLFLASTAAGISSSDTDSWHTAFGWGNHALYGYLTTNTGINWFSAIGHNHDSSYAALGHLHSGVYSPTTHTHDYSWTNQFTPTNSSIFIRSPTNDVNCTNKILYSYGPGNRVWLDPYSISSVSNWMNFPTNIDQSYVFAKVNIGPSNLFTTAPYPLNIKGIDSARAQMSIIGGIMLTNQESGFPGFAESYTNSLTPCYSWGSVNFPITNLYLSNGFTTATLMNENNYSHILRLSFWNLNVPLNAIVLGVIVSIETSCNYADSSIFGHWVRLWNNGYVSSAYTSTYVETVHPTFTRSTWGASNSIWGLNSLSSAEINANDFAVEFWERKVSGGSGAVFIRNIKLTVYYSCNELAWTHGVAASGNYTIRDERNSQDVLTLSSNSVCVSALALGTNPPITTWPAGMVGSNGVDGATGPQGPAGTNGVDGATGPQGPAGTNGVDGATGPQGPAGTNGVDGATGPQGSAGTNGVDGATGPAGPVTNQIMDVNGTLYTITNTPTENYVLKFNPANSTAWFAAESGTGGTAIAGTYPVLNLKLDGQWTDFELKASTNNFTDLVYYYISSRTNATADDTNVWVYFTDDYHADPRKWIRQHPVSKDIYSQLSNPLSVVESVYVYPSHDCAVAWTNWMSKDNTNLIWSYVRFDGIDFEKNYDSTIQHWTAVQPVQWVGERLWIENTSVVTNADMTNKVFSTFLGTGKHYLGNDATAPWIEGLGTTNIMFGAGTNVAIFGSPW